MLFTTPCFILTIVSILRLSLATPLRPRSTYPAAYCTTADLSYQLSSISAPQHGSRTTRRGETPWDIFVDDSSTGYKQTIDGFGAAVTDATVSTFDSLQSSTLDRLLSELTTSHGANFGIVRHTIGASDLSGDPAYTYNDNSGEPDLSLEGFSLGDRGTAMADLLAKMKTKRPDLKIVGSPWSAPGWMKMNGVLTGNITENNLSDQYLDKTRPNYSDQFAQYFVKYIRAFESLGAPIDSITLQNEPLNSQAELPTMYMYDQEAADLTKNYVIPALRADGLQTTVWAYDHNTDTPSYPQTVLDQSGEDIDTVAWHCYANSTDWKTLTIFHDRNPHVKQYMTECWTPVPDAATWHQAANFTIGPLQNWASGVMAWTLGTDTTFGPFLSSGGCHTCRGLVTIQDDGSYTYNIAYYLMAQFSRFMPRGSVVLAGSGNSEDPTAPGVQSVASRNPDGTISVVVMNTLGQDLNLQVHLASQTMWSGRIPLRSVVTWVLPVGE